LLPTRNVPISCVFDAVVNAMADLRRPICDGIGMPWIRSISTIPIL
jgi:hypothetical protein